MGYLIKAGLGLVLFIGGIVLFNVKLVVLLETGTCASGGPYVSARPCPEGTGTAAMLMVAGIFAGLIGAGIFAFRGDPPWGRRPHSVGLFGMGTLAWGLFFTATGATSLYTALTNDTIGEDGELGGIIVGATFLLMGLPALLIALWNLLKGLGSGRDESPARVPGGVPGAPSPRVASGGGSGDAIAKIERLQKLRESGAINDQEFEREKAKVLAQQ